MRKRQVVFLLACGAIFTALIFGMSRSIWNECNKLKVNHELVAEWHEFPEVHATSDTSFARLGPDTSIVFHFRGHSIIEFVGTTATVRTLFEALKVHAD